MTMHQIDRIEQKLQHLLDRYGKYFIYIRTMRRFPCSCWKSLMEEADSHHETCLGTGYTYQAEKWLGHIQMVGSSGNQATADGNTIVGLAQYNQLVCFFERPMFPSDGDMLLEVEWNVARDNVPYRGIATRLVAAYQISAIEHISGKQGSIVGHKCAIHIKNWDHTWKEDLVKDLSFTDTHITQVLPSAPSTGMSM